MCPGFWSHTEPWTPKPEAPAVKPLLVDELAEALYWLLNLHHDVSKGGSDPETGQPYPVTDEEWKAAIDKGMQVHACYQKEVGDA